MHPRNKSVRLCLLILIIFSDILLIAGSLCYTIAGTSIAWPSPTLIKMAGHETPLTLDVTQISWMVSLMFVGHLTSPIIAGFLMDWFGRKRTCLYASILPFLSWLLIFLSYSVVYLYIARFAAGLWIGLTTTIMPLYIGEIAIPSLRSSLSTVNNLLLNLGVLFVYIVGPNVSYFSLAIICEVITLIYICTYVLMPESPYYYIKHGKREKAFNALSWLRKGKSKERIENEISRMERALDDLQGQKGTLKDIFFDPGNRKAFIISVSYSSLRRLSGSGVLQAYASITLPTVTMGILDPDTCVIIIGVSSLLSSFVSTAVTTRVSRRILVTISCLGCTVPLTAIMTWFYLDQYSTIEVQEYSDVIFWSMIVFYCFFNLSLGPVGASIKGEVFTAKVKGLSSSLITINTAVVAFILNKYYLIIAEKAGMYVNYLIFSISCIVAIVFTWTYVPQIEDKTLEEIHEILRQSSRRTNKSNKSVKSNKSAKSSKSAKSGKYIVTEENSANKKENQENGSTFRSEKT